MYPLLLKSPVKDYLWGGTRLIDEFGFEASGEKAAEAWVLSCHKAGESLVKNGEFSGLTLSEAIARLGKGALGSKAAAFPYFPILIKLIDAKDRLSIQVHPDDAYALKNEGEYGKTEVWYVVDCEEGAQLIYGLNKKVSREEFKRRIKNNTLTEICNYVPVKKGDVFFIPAGMLHAIGKGILIAEIQQNSNTTYRVSDYGRIGADGKPRPLHIDKAVDVTDIAPPSIKYGAIGEITIYPFGLVRDIAECEFFTSQLLKLNGNAGLCEEESFLSLLVIDGDATISYPSGNIHIAKGDSVFVPAGIRIAITGKADIICSHI